MSQRKLARLVALVALGAAGLALASVVAGTAFAHTDPCHTRHDCPSDHHTYVWYGNGGAWDCARPGATEYDPSRDTTVIVWEGLTYFCRSAGGTTTTTTTSSASTSTSTATSTSTTTTTATTTTSTTTTTAPPPPSPPSQCQARGSFPDRICTPGTVFATATKAKVCRRGYSATVRNVPDSVKRVAYARYGIASHAPGQYEVDHLIALELGGSNSIRNLWPEAALPRPGFHEKDKVESYLHRQVCAGRMTLRLAQRRIATNWLGVYAKIK